MQHACVVHAPFGVHGRALFLALHNHVCLLSASCALGARQGVASCMCARRTLIEGRSVQEFPEKLRIFERNAELLREYYATHDTVPHKVRLLLTSTDIHVPLFS